VAPLEALFARPIAHRGLHDRSRGVIENTPSAVRAAVEAGYGIEVDVQRTAEGEAVVFHDDTLDRLTEASGAVAAYSLAELRRVPFRQTSDRFWTLDELLEEIAGRSPLFVEIKSQFDDGTPLASRVGARLAAYRGPAAAESFDPGMVGTLRAEQPGVPRGIIGCAFADDEDWAELTGSQRFAMRHLLHWASTRPDFLSWDVHDLPRASATLARRLAGTPISTWTVRTPADQARAGLYADQMVFEGFRP
jgi:glycerophosphoryl diester phosphodiesterase